jgi:hypothetical protein
LITSNGKSWLTTVANTEFQLANLSAKYAVYVAAGKLHLSRTGAGEKF